MPKVYTLSGNHGEYESNKWNGIIGNNNSTISVNWLLSLSGSGKTFYFSGDMTGTYQNYRLNSPQDVDLSAYEKIDDSSKAELTYWATTDYGGTKYTSYFYYKKVTQQLHQYSLQLAVNIAFDPRIYGDCGAFLSTTDFTPRATDNPNRFHLLNVNSDGSGEVQYVEISMMDRASEPKIEDFSIRVTSGYNETTTVYGRNFKLYTYGKYKDSGSSPRWNYLEEESEYLLLNVVKLS